MRCDITTFEPSSTCSFLIISPSTISSAISHWSSVTRRWLAEYPNICRDWRAQKRRISKDGSGQYKTLYNHASTSINSTLLLRWPSRISFKSPKPSVSKSKDQFGLGAKLKKRSIALDWPSTNSFSKGSHCNSAKSSPIRWFSFRKQWEDVNNGSKNNRNFRRTFSLPKTETQNWEPFPLKSSLERCKF